MLLETPHCRPERPLYIAGLHDDIDAISSRLEARVGPDGYDLIDGFDELDDLDDGDVDDDIFDDDFDDDEVLTVEGIEAPSGTPK